MANRNVLKFVQEEDFVEYFIYVVPSLNNNDENLLISYLSKIETIVQKYTDKYLWHRDDFKLKPITKLISTFDECLTGNASDFQPHLHGITHYGDNIEDEWFIVFLLLQITRELNDVIVRIIDNDGEFLLIEAADYLPEWANPEICEKRVYIHQGKIHIIPLENRKKIEKVTTLEALKKILTNPIETEASTDIQKSIYDRIKNYPDKISENLHRATLYLPIGVAAILKAKPQLVAPAVIAFCNRDQIDLKTCRAMKFFPPENRVLTSVIFTKHLYAMLTHNTYMPDRRTGWNLPPVNSELFKAHSLGVRLACGFEILVSQVKSQNDIESDRNWHIFLDSLKKNNYFRDLLEHSKEYDVLLSQAKEYYKEIKELEHTFPTIGKEILHLSKTLEYNLDEFKEAEKHLPSEDDDSWLNINPADLDTLLETRYGKHFNSNNGNTDPVNITKKLTDFMNHMSSMEGAEFPDEPTNENASPSRPKRGIKTKKPNFSDSPKINFDPNEFTNAIQNILDIPIPDDSWDLESGSEMSEYENEYEGMSLDEQMEEGKMIKSYMKAMDEELATTTIGQSFEKVDVDDFDDIENFQPINIDRNTVKNIFKSYKAQLGGAGPAENLLGPMGVKFDDLNIDDDE